MFYDSVPQYYPGRRVIASPAFSLAASHITSDGTLGTTINQAGTIYNIDGGTIKGTNQFHSFGLFSVGTGIPRVLMVRAGSQTSSAGDRRAAVRHRRTPQVYDLRGQSIPSQSVRRPFRRNAALDVSGSFHVSTADYLRMADGAKFNADLGKQSTLSTAPVAAFGFLSNTPAAISIQESYLSVPEGKTLSIIGGDINITGGPTVRSLHERPD